MPEQEKRPLFSTHYKVFAVVVVLSIIVAFAIM